MQEMERIHLYSVKAHVSACLSYTNMFGIQRENTDFAFYSVSELSIGFYRHKGQCVTVSRDVIHSLQHRVLFNLLLHDQYILAFSVCEKMLFNFQVVLLHHKAADVVFSDRRLKRVQQMAIVIY